MTKGLRLAGSIVAIACAMARPALAQDATAHLFGCSDSAVSVAIQRNPPLKFEPLAHRPAVPLPWTDSRQFTFAHAPFRTIQFFFTATVAEESVGRSSAALLTIYAETTPVKSKTAGSAQSQWWQIVRMAAGSERAASDLLFEASRLGACVGNQSEDGRCSFADLSLATLDRELPLFTVGFGMNLGGANSNNWTEARLLLDFRASPPRVAATAECDYNEGGGACTAIDSSMMPRFSFTCDWSADAADFLCTEQSSEQSPAHRDFYLLSDHRPPRRPGELESIEDAARRLATGRIGDAVVVRGLGRVQLIADVKMPSNADALIFRAPGEFVLVRRSSGEFAPALRVVPHLPTYPPLSLENADAEEPGGTSPEWTSDVTQLVTSREVFRDSTLVVLQTVEVDSSGSPAALYWLGIDFSQPPIVLDAVQLVDGGVYDHCGEEKVPATVTSVGKITRPFHASVVFRPPTIRNINSDDQAGEWDAGEGGDNDSFVECARGGTIAWEQGRFVAAIDKAPCRTPEKPQSIVILPDGRLRVEKPRTPQP